MDLPDTPAHAVRHDGWTRECIALFLEHLSHRGNVRAACASVGMSREAAYRLRRRDALFARGWNAALVLARAASVEMLADRALDGIEEEVWYRGELVGTRRRFDTRLLLAHLARLDKQVEDDAGTADAERFDQILACVAGEPVPEALAGRDGGPPESRSETMIQAAEDARERVHDRWVEATGATEDGHTLDDEQWEAFSAECDAAAEEAALAAAALWDEWHARACETVDGLVGGRRTVSGVSTSPAADGDMHR